MHAENTRRIEELNATRLEATLDAAKLTWNEQGYNAAEIEMLEEAWALGAIKNKETYREDKKLRKELLAKVKESRANRTK